MICPFRHQTDTDSVLFGVQNKHHLNDFCFDEGFAWFWWLIFVFLHAQQNMSFVIITINMLTYISNYSIQNWITTTLICITSPVLGCHKLYLVVVILFSNIIHEQNSSNIILNNNTYTGFCIHVLCWRPPQKALAYLAGGSRCTGTRTCQFEYRRRHKIFNTLFPAYRTKDVS